jgi:hypothetical protein
MIRSAIEQDIEPVLCLWDAAGSLPSVTDTREGLLRLLATDRQALLIWQGDRHATLCTVSNAALSGGVLRNVALWLRPVGWPLLPDAVRRRTLLLAWAAILAQVVFVGGWVLAGALEPGYSHVREYISELGRHGAAHPWIFTVFVGIWGLGFIALAVALVPSLRTRPWPPGITTRTRG